MPRESLIGPNTEIGKQILQDFMNYKVTGFQPWGTVGGANHWRSRDIYQTVAKTTFRTQARNIALQAFEALQITEEDMMNWGNRNNYNVETDYDESLTMNSERPNHASLLNKDKPNNEQTDSSDEDDDSYRSSNRESCSDDDLNGFDDIEMGELQNSRSPFLTVYPTGDKLLAIFPLDGNVFDPHANKFEFIDDNNAIRRLGKIPKERENCVALIGRGTEKRTKMGFTDVDLMLVEAQITKRLKANKYERDSNEDIWETRATLQLPFKCDPQLRGRHGQALNQVPMRSGKRGFTWAYFWLLAWKPPQAKRGKRIGGTFVKIMSKEDSSVYTEKTYESKKKKC